MSDNELTFSPGDHRRATSLMLHHAAADREGMAEVWREAAEVGSWPGLAAAVIGAVFEINPVLRSPEGIAALRELARSYAALEAAEDGDSGA
jgi:hypothetical protein